MPEISHSKVNSLIDKYNLSGIGEELEQRWKGDYSDRERMSLRDLTDFFNKRLIESALLTSGEGALDPELDEIYRYLTSDDVTTGQRKDKRNELRESGIDVDDLESDFVTYQSIRSYLKDWRGVEPPETSVAEKLEKDSTAVKKLLTRSETVADATLTNSRNTDRIALGEFEVDASVEMLCRECGRRTPVLEIIDQGGCTCRLDDSST